MLIIPATFSALFVDTWRSRLWIAYAFGLGATVFGLVFSYILDFSGGPPVVAFLGLGLIFGAIIKIIRQKKNNLNLHASVKKLKS